jgi:hypothetical protein
MALLAMETLGRKPDDRGWLDQMLGQLARRLDSRLESAP